MAFLHAREIDLVPPLPLYIGSVGARAHVEAHGITHVLCLQTASERRGYEHLMGLLPAHVEEKTFDYFEDAEGLELADFVSASIQWIDAAFAKEGRVLVHCAAGVSRSAAIVTAYLMYRFDLGADVALERLRLARGCAHPRQSFMRQLREEIPLLLQELRLSGL